MSKRGNSFLAVGITFLIIGLFGNRVFLTLGLVFLALGLSRFARRRRPRP